MPQDRRRVGISKVCLPSRPATLYSPAGGGGRCTRIGGQFASQHLHLQFGHACLLLVQLILGCYQRSTQIFDEFPQSQDYGLDVRKITLTVANAFLAAKLHRG